MEGDAMVFGTFDIAGNTFSSFYVASRWTCHVFGEYVDNGGQIWACRNC